MPAAFDIDKAFQPDIYAHVRRGRPTYRRFLRLIGASSWKTAAKSSNDIPVGSGTVPLPRLPLAGVLAITGPPLGVILRRIGAKIYDFAL